MLLEINRLDLVRIGYVTDWCQISSEPNQGTKADLVALNGICTEAELIELHRQLDETTLGRITGGIDDGVVNPVSMSDGEACNFRSITSVAAGEEDSTQKLMPKSTNLSVSAINQRGLIVPIPREVI